MVVKLCVVVFDRIEEEVARLLKEGVNRKFKSVKVGV